MGKCPQARREKREGAITLAPYGQGGAQFVCSTGMSSVSPCFWVAQTAQQECVYHPFARSHLPVNLPSCWSKSKPLASFLLRVDSTPASAAWSVLGSHAPVETPYAHAECFGYPLVTLSHVSLILRSPEERGEVFLPPVTSPRGLLRP